MPLRSANRRQRWRDRSSYASFATPARNTHNMKGASERSRRPRLSDPAYPARPPRPRGDRRRLSGNAGLGSVMLDAFFSPRRRGPRRCSPRCRRVCTGRADAFRQHLTATRYAAERLTIAGPDLASMPDVIAAAALIGLEPEPHALGARQPSATGGAHGDSAATSTRSNLHDRISKRRARWAWSTSTSPAWRSRRY